MKLESPLRRTDYENMTHLEISLPGGFFKPRLWTLINAEKR